ncbi:MAG: 2-oxo acid dehydrogenase subunit E2 [Deltaproteobacteria bacterium]|nr:2-oxo acid dehydrogenase subunit E2 [Deltaproteobacteria bacterium]
MRWEFRLPDIGEGVAEGEIVAWQVAVGDVLAEDQPMVEVMTDKATVGIGAPRAGKVVELGGKVGDVVKVGAVLIVLDTAGAADAATPHPDPHAMEGRASQAGASEAKGGNGKPGSNGHGAPSKDGPAATAVGDIKESLPGIGLLGGKTATRRDTPPAGAAGGSAVAASALAVQPASVARAPVVAPYVAPSGTKPLATPATRKLARDLGIDLRAVRPTGKHGRVTSEDVRNVRAAVEQAASAPPPAGAGVSRGEPARGPSTRAPIAIESPADRKALEERKPFVGMRRRIAERMALSKHTAAHFTFVEECDVTALKAVRDRLRPRAEARGAKLTYLPFVVKAVVSGLKRQPILNSALDESTQELVYKGYYDIGIAAATDAGLVVPVVRDADKKSILDLAREIEELGQGARAGTLKPAQLGGSTFTITSLGAQGGLFATPIVNFPEVAILGVHRIKERPVVKDGQIVIGNVMLLSLSFDHRIIDGHVGAQFAYDVIGNLEDPDSLFLDMV